MMCLIVYLIYFFTASSKITYLSLGDSLALGENAYGDIQYGYSDYVASYLERSDRLFFYTKSFAKSGSRIEDMKNAIMKNETIQIEKKQYALKELLRKADIVTLSIGANDILNGLTEDGFRLSLLEEEDVLQKIDETCVKLKELLQLLKKYVHKEVILVGYYNPYKEENPKVNRLFTYFENGYQKIAEEMDIHYLSTSMLFKNHDDYLPNPFNIHPGSKGYSAIASKIIDYLEENILNSLAK